MMNRKSDIAIIKSPLTSRLDIVINGWSISEIVYDDDILIKDEETAIKIAKKFVDVLEEEFGEVKNEDYPNDSKLSPNVDCVEGYETPQFTQEEYEEYMEKRAPELFDDFLDFLDCDCCD